jgi:predicted RNA-binding Zn-ribbon protein involved in translation (DUF1610 family)
MSDLLAKCEVCQALLDEEDLFCSNCGAEAPDRQNVKAAHTRTSTHNFDCRGCGASMSYDASAGSLRCPFCGSEELDESQSSTALSPNRVMPFAVSHNDATARMTEWLGRGFWRPGNLSEQAIIVTMTAVYVPYWVFEATTHTYWTADTNHTPSGARGDWFPMSGEHHGDYQGVLVGASGALSPAETAAICPFDLGPGVSPDKIDLDDVTVEQFSVPRKYARPLARQGLETMERDTCQDRYVPGRARNMKVNTRIEGLASEPVLLPIWIMAYRYNERVFRFLANGQTGKCTGTAPTSLKKIATAVAVGIGAVILIIGMVAAFSR